MSSASTSGDLQSPPDNFFIRLPDDLQLRILDTLDPADITDRYTLSSCVQAYPWLADSIVPRLCAKIHLEDLHERHGRIILGGLSEDHLRHCRHLILDFDKLGPETKRWSADRFQGLEVLELVLDPSKLARIKSRRGCTAFEWATRQGREICECAVCALIHELSPRTLLVRLPTLFDEELIDGLLRLQCEYLTTRRQRTSSSATTLHAAASASTVVIWPSSVACENWNCCDINIPMLIQKFGHLFIVFDSDTTVRWRSRHGRELGILAPRKVLVRNLRYLSSCSNRMDDGKHSITVVGVGRLVDLEEEDFEKKEEEIQAGFADEVRALEAEVMSPDGRHYPLHFVTISDLVESGEAAKWGIMSAGEWRELVMESVELGRIDEDQ